MKTCLLIVDDHGEIRRLVRLTFDPDRHEIHEAVDGAEALALARRVRPRVVLLDVMMPGPLNGLEVCRGLKAEPLLSGLHVVLLSARGQRSDIDAGLAAGADGYFVKPFSPVALLDHVERLVQAEGAR
ncbi:response regulator [Ramlibacter sp. 2FC]|uniref:response regulator transcription factor n=1 Tax=Ramlibacter sp. 2FC TaxID=2502188 RepID=UPI0010F68271|nr:response regulator [Ramlibacter sp. 2FC]